MPPYGHQREEASFVISLQHSSLHRSCVSVTYTPATVTALRETLRQILKLSIPFHSMTCACLCICYGNKNIDSRCIHTDTVGNRHQVSDPFVREMFMADDNKPLPNIAADANALPVVLMPNGMAMGGGAMANPMAAPMNPMGGPYQMMGGGMPMGPMGPMGPIAPPGPQQMGQMGGPMGGPPMQMQPPQGE